MSAAPAPVGALHAIVIDCAAPARLARFWSLVLDAPVADVDDDWASVESSPGLGFQRVPEPRTTKNRVHVDVRVDDFTVAGARVCELGATPLGPVHGEPGYPWRVYADPEGNEFCLVSR